MEKRIVRSQSDRIVAGVCGGIADYFDVDTTIIRILFVLFTFAGGSAVIVYFIFWLIIPEEEGETEGFAKDVEKRFQQGAESIKFSFAKTTRRKWSQKQVLGPLLILFGGILLLQQYVPQLAFRHIWPVVLILLGAWMIFTSFPSVKTPKDEEKKIESQDDDSHKEDTP